MTHDEPTDRPDDIETSHGPRSTRRRAYVLGAAALLGMGAIAVGGIASARSSDTTAATAAVPTTMVPSAVPASVGDLDQPDDIDDEFSDADDGAGDGDEGRSDGDSDEIELDVSAADEEVFARFDQCLVDAGLDDAAFEELERAEMDGTLDEARLDERWAAADAAFESCEPILDELSPELQNQLEVLDAAEDDGLYDDCEPHEGSDQEPADGAEDEADDEDGDDDGDEGGEPTDDPDSDDGPGTDSGS